MATLDEQYEALTAGAGLVDFAGRTRIEVTGDDRASFLHNLSTNDVKGLTPGSGCEAFFLNARGHVLAHVFIICRPESLVVEAVSGQCEFLLNHLNRYLIREQVELHDRTAEWGEVLLAGDRAPAVLGKISSGNLPAVRLENCELLIAGQAATVVRVAMTPSVGYLLFSSAGSMAVVHESLLSHGATIGDQAALEAARVEAGFPFYGSDITDQNLPQEVARDALAISFKKGCYLGQETVARIDALGHVNKTLVRLEFDGPQVPPVGTELRAGEQVVGQITSAAFSPRTGVALALGIIRRGHHTPGTTLESGFGICRIAPSPSGRGL